MTQRFAMRGHPSEQRRRDHLDAVQGKLHEVITAIELSAAVLGNVAIHDQATAARRALDVAATADTQS